MLTNGFVALSIAISAIAAPGGSPRNECNTGPLQCCMEVVPASNQKAATLLGSLGIDPKDITGQVGLNCSPITIIGLGQGSNCAQGPLCCTNSNFNGLISLGCTPIPL